ncbi:16853_t:CDS:1, partial [Racocetra fulgida]
VDIRNMKIQYQHCSMLYFLEEQTARDLNQFISCCYKDIVVLPPFTPFLEELKSLFLN